ncbi:hypothetical protein IHE44_0001926 [Lamprotornis superbus]|uniref:Glycerol kinase n=1 Tax=Lamprotornis superbus TaxID=245042 RepID=A0A835NQ74_9PASS|nr:hypothetical protein IHE44_0001926 [Lamprotornis superbus]
METSHEANCWSWHLHPERNFHYMAQAEEAAKKNNCCFGTVDTWLLYRLTKGSVYATDYSNASSTAIFEPFTKCWTPTLCNLLSIPMSIYPPVKDTSFNFGSTDSEIFGVPIPIMAVVCRNKLLYDIIVKKVHIPLRTIRADGGVSNNSFVMQMTSDLINKKIEKPTNADMSCLGAAFLAGLASGSGHSTRSSSVEEKPCGKRSAFYLYSLCKNT